MSTLLTCLGWSNDNEVFAPRICERSGRDRDGGQRGLFRDTAAAAQPAPATGPAVLTGTEFDLRIGETAVNFTGRRANGAHDQRLAAGADCCAGARATR